MRQPNAERLAQVPDCDVEGCDSVPWAKGKCKAHYSRLWRGSKDDGPIRGYESKAKMAERSSYRGAGIVECHLCGLPVRDHSITEWCNVGAV